ncbi:MAG: hypothetical protein K2Y22_13250 [Candidatus Obscuribacterales bacterium]|nr:hypothetical protein [Candidatus Obscuribacterales bacterium]
MTDKITLNPTEPLDADKHDRSAFSCGVAALDLYLKQQARKEADQNIAQTFVLTSKKEPGKILGYYSLSANRIKISDLPKELTKRFPRYDDIGVTLLGRFAVDKSAQRGRLRLGEHLLTDAKLKSWQASCMVASFGMIVDVLVAEKGDPTDFYLKYDFVAFPDKTNKLYLPMLTIERTLRASGLI